MRAGCVQFAVREGEPEANLAQALAGITRLAGRGARLILLPEMFSTGFDYGRLPALAAGTPLVLERLRAEAARLGVALCGSLPEIEGGRVFNTCYLIDERGEVTAAYRKVHLFPPTGEPAHFAAGGSPVLGSAAGLRLGLLTCFDLRFPELARALTLAGAEALCVVAQWPAARAAHWRLLARARALENQLPLAACNACGVTASGLRLGGGSLMCSAEGEVLAEAGEESAEIAAELDPESAQEFRRGLPALAVRRPEVYRLGPRAGKVTGAAELAERLSALQAAGGKVVFTNGCFDLLHVGHVRYLAEARGLGDCLVVGLNTDTSVRRLKGAAGRPVVPEERRAEVLASLEAVDHVVLFDEDTPERLIGELRPDVLVKGADWALTDIVGREIVEARGGRVVRVATTPGVSTSALIEAIQRGR